MAARTSSLIDPRIELITRIIGDHRNAPNLWLARTIMQALNEFEARTNSSRQECMTDWYSDWDGIDRDGSRSRRTN